tara:strand:+ start:333 stop:449 length:117 start_codon:yes stop_codon:yes gene_type:complete
MNHCQNAEEEILLLIVVILLMLHSVEALKILKREIKEL